jgi:Concanavalin A-like lectin/glucanases superfamily
MNSRLACLKKLSASLGLFGLIGIVVGSSLAIAQTPVAHWTFDDGLNNYDLTTVTDVVNGNNAVWQHLDADQNFDTNGLSYAPGQIGGAVRLGGGTDRFFRVESVPQIDGIVATPNFGEGDPVLGVGVTWSAWMYVDSSNVSSNQGVLVGRTVTDETTGGQGVNQNWAMNWVNGGQIDSRVSGTASISPSDSISPNQWHNVVLVWGNVGNVDEFSFMVPSQRLYIDGVLKGEIANSGVFKIDSGGSWLIGEDSCCTGREFQGLLDDFAIFDSALSTAQVEALYNHGLNGINASGMNTAAILAGDVDGSGVVEVADFGIIRDNLGKTVAARNLGDLDGNRKVDLNDYQQWLQIVHPALAAAALQAYSGSVPEPSSLLLAALAATAGYGIRSSRLRMRDRSGC